MRIPGATREGRRAERATGGTGAAGGPASPQRGEAKLETRFVVDGGLDRFRALEGTELRLTGADGETHRFRVGQLPKRLVGTQRQRTEYFDTEDFALAREGHMLRGRAKLSADGSVKEVELEAQLADGDGLRRVTGGTFSPEDWAGERGALVRGDSKDVSVRTVQDELVGGAALGPVASKEKERTLLFVYPVSDNPLVRFVVPDVVSRIRRPLLVMTLDEVSARGGVGGEGAETRGQEVEVQIFTKVPWLHPVRSDDDPRIPLFASLCDELRTRFGVTPDGRSGYQATLEETGVRALDTES